MLRSSAPAESLPKESPDMSTSNDERGGRSSLARGRRRKAPMHPEARREINALKSRVETLEQELEESRRLNRRIAELADLVGQVLVTAVDRQDERLLEALRKYDQSL